MGEKDVSIPYDQVMFADQPIKALASSTKPDPDSNMTASENREKGWGALGRPIVLIKETVYGL